MTDVRQLQDQISDVFFGSWDEVSSCPIGAAFALSQTLSGSGRLGRELHSVVHQPKHAITLDHSMRFRLVQLGLHLHFDKKKSGRSAGVAASGRLGRKLH